MKHISILIALIVISLSASAQSSCILTHTDNNQSFYIIKRSPSGQYHAFSYGVTGTCNGINHFVFDNTSSSWQQRSSCSSSSTYAAPTAVHFIDNSTIVVAMGSPLDGAANESAIIKSTDGGVTWSKKYTINTFNGTRNAASLAFVDANNGIALMDDGSSAYFLKTTDGGDTWTDHLTGQFSDVYHKRIVAMNNVYYVQSFYNDQGWGASAKWHIYKSTDKGVTWSKTYDESTSIYYSFQGAMQFLSATEGFVAIQNDSTKGNSNLKKTVDGGTTWTDVLVPTSVLPEKFSINDIHFINSNEGYLVFGNHCDSIACYRGLAVLYTSDGGANWTRVIHKPYEGHALYSMDFDPQAKTGFVSGCGIGSDAGNIYTLTQGPSSVGSVLKHSSISIYPNPSASGAFNIKYDAQQIGQLKVFSIDGKLMHSQEIKNGSSELATTLSSGIYFYTLYNDYKVATETGKLLVE